MKRMMNRFLAVLAGVLLSVPIVSVAQDYFQASGIPVQRSAISSSEFRTEFSNIETLLSDKLPAYTGNGDNFVTVNAGGTALTSLTPAAAATALGVPSVSAASTITGLWTFENQLDIDDGNSLRFYDSTDTDFADFSHDGTDFNTAFTTTTDWNLTGITALAAGTVDADFDAITGTSYGGITEANLVDKSAAETIAGAWTLPVASITAHEAAIDHDALLGFVAGEHVLVGALDHDALLGFVSGEHLLVGAIDHNLLLNFVTNEHLNWVNDLGGTNLHVNNAANQVLALTSGEVTQLANIGATTITAADWTATAALVGTNTGDQTITLTGEVTGSGTGSFAATIQPVAVSGQTSVTGVAGDEVLVLDATDGLLKRVDVGDFISAGASELNDLSDVVLTTPATGAFLRFDSANFIDALLVAADIPTLDAAKIGTGTFADARIATHTGDVTGQASLTIVADAVTYAKMQNVVADERILGNIAGAGGIVTELTASQVRTMINVENGSTADQTSIVGITGTSAEFDTALTAANFAFSGGAFHDGFSDFVANEHLDWTADLGGTNLHANNSANGALALTSGEVTQLANIGATTISGADWTAVAALVGTNSGDQTITLTGDVTGSGTASFAATIAADSVSMDKIQDIATDSFLGRITAATGTVEILTNAQAKSALDLTGTNSGDEAAASLTVQGIVELATIAETNTGTDATRGVTPDGLDGWTGNSALVTSSNAALALTSGEVTQLANINATVVSTSDWTAVAALVGTNTGDEAAASESVSGIVERATQAEVNTSTDTTRYISPNVLAAATITTDNLSAAEVGYKGTPINTQNGNYTLVLGDAAKTIFKASGGAGETITIPANSAVPYPIGTIIVVLNGGGGTLLLAITTDTLTQVGTGLTGTRTLADDAMVSLLKVTAIAWYVSGTGTT